MKKIVLIVLIVLLFVATGLIFYDWAGDYIAQAAMSADFTQ